jgi:flagellar assembly protein FliH
MRDGFPFSLRLDDNASPIVGGTRRRPRPARDKTTIQFNYPPLETLAAPEPPPPPEAAPEPPSPPPTFSEEELSAAVEAARQEAYAAADARVRTEMLASLEHRQAEALTAISERLAASQEAIDRILGARAGASRDLALAVARALVAKALARQPLADIEAMLREVVVRLEGLPWLELRLPPSLVDAGQAALTRAAEEADYRGELRVIPDARLGPGDARLIWRDGAAERDLARLEAQVTALVEAWLPAAGSPTNRPAPISAGGAGTDTKPLEVVSERRVHEAPAIEVVESRRRAYG